MLRIDAHTHILADDYEAQCLAAHQMALMNISVMTRQPIWDAHHIYYRQMRREHPQCYAWCTSFDPYEPDQPGYADRIIRQLEADLESGAVACKIWKNVGMEIRNSNGHCLLPDDPLYDPVFRHLEARTIPLLAHLAEPLACWLPLDHPSPHQAYYRSEPQWHMHGRTDMASHEQILAARDRLLERYPQLRIIGAHLGSLEHDLGALAERFRRYPHFAVDTSARTPDLLCHDWHAVRDLFEAWPDRIIWGTDMPQMTEPSQLTQAQREQALHAYLAVCRSDFAYFETDAPCAIRSFESRGLALDTALLERFYHANACAWYPGLALQFADMQMTAP